MAWYGDYIARHGADGAEGRLVSLLHFAEPWDSWEMHPAGDEVVVCIAGEIILIQEIEGRTQRRIHLTPGDYAINAKGVWHTVDTVGEVAATALFITAGLGTEGRAR
jgi:quercetin dioxygenase-like cupin family protein